MVTTRSRSSQGGKAPALLAQEISPRKKTRSGHDKDDSKRSGQRLATGCASNTGRPHALQDLLAKAKAFRDSTSRKRRRGTDAERSLASDEQPTVLAGQVKSCHAAELQQPAVVEAGYDEGLPSSRHSSKGAGTSEALEQSKRQKLSASQVGHTKSCLSEASQASNATCATHDLRFCGATPSSAHQATPMEVDWNSQRSGPLHAARQSSVAGKCPQPQLNSSSSSDELNGCSTDADGCTLNKPLSDLSSQTHYTARSCNFSGAEWRAPENGEAGCSAHGATGTALEDSDAGCTLQHAQCGSRTDSQNGAEAAANSALGGSSPESSSQLDPLRRYRAIRELMQRKKQCRFVAGKPADPEEYDGIQRELDSMCISQAEWDAYAARSEVEKAVEWELKCAANAAGFDALAEARRIASSNAFETGKPSSATVQLNRRVVCDNVSINVVGKAIVNCKSSTAISTVDNAYVCGHAVGDTPELPGQHPAMVTYMPSVWRSYCSLDVTKAFFFPNLPLELQSASSLLLQDS